MGTVEALWLALERSHSQKLDLCRDDAARVPASDAKADARPLALLIGAATFTFVRPSAWLGYATVNFPARKRFAGSRLACGMLSTLVVVPTFNEADNVGASSPVSRVVPGAHVLVVDDASPDGTAVRVREAAQAMRSSTCWNGARSSASVALVAGLLGAGRGFERFFEMDADFSHDPRYLPVFVAALDAGATSWSVHATCRGVRFTAGDRSAIVVEGGSGYSRLILSASLQDMTALQGYHARARADRHPRAPLNVTRSESKRLPRRAAGLKLARANRVHRQARGASKMTLHEVWEVLERVAMPGARSALMHAASLDKIPTAAGRCAASTGLRSGGTTLAS